MHLVCTFWMRCELSIHKEHVEVISKSVVMLISLTLISLLWYMYVLLNLFGWLQGEPFSKVKDRLQKKLGIPEKEFEKVCTLNCKLQCKPAYSLNDL